MAVLALLISVVLINYIGFSNVDEGCSVSLSVVDVFFDIEIMIDLISEIANLIDSIFRIKLLIFYFGFNKGGVEYCF